MRCLCIDFSKAFDIVDHCVLAQKLAGLRLPEQIYMWILSFLSDRSQQVKWYDQLSTSRPINLVIIQGSGIGPMVEWWSRSLHLMLVLRNRSTAYSVWSPVTTEYICHTWVDIRHSWFIQSTAVVGHKPGTRLPSPHHRLDSQPQNITALWPEPNYTAWWCGSMCVC